MLDIILGLPHSSTLGPLLFNVFLAYSFFDVNDNDIASYADDNITPYLVDVDNLISCIWVILNLLKSNADKYYLLVSTNDRVSINVAGCEIANLMKSWPLMITSLTCFVQRHTLNGNWEEMHTHGCFFHLAVYHSRANNNIINRFYEGYSRIALNHRQPSFDELLGKDGSASIHISRNIQI